MGYTLTDKIFGLFGVNAKRKDTYKDLNDKGITQRYHEAIAAEYDEFLAPLIDDFIANTMMPRTMLLTLIPNMMDMLGGVVVVSDSEFMKRKIIGFFRMLYRIKGTRTGYEVLLRLLGFYDIVITVTGGSGGFDSGTFDDPGRTFDSYLKCGCKKYTLTLSANFTITPEIEAAVARIIEFNEPINAKLTGIIYNVNELYAVEYEDVYQ